MSFLEVNGVNKSYGNRRALLDFSLSVDRSQIVALVGPDGAGKTSMMRIIFRLIDADSGEVHIDGKNITSDFSALKLDLGYMPQQFSLYSDLSVEENLIFYGGLYGITGRAFEEKRDYLYKFSNLGPFASRRAGALSGGMKQKLALSCALIHNPKLLILDEPTTGVDPLSRRQFWEILLDLKKQGVAILVATPYMDEVMRCDRAILIHEGKRLSAGTPTGLAETFEGQLFYAELQPSSELLRQLNEISGLRAARFGSGLHVSLNQNDSLNNHSADLSALNIAVDQFTPIAPGLEDRFIQLMGQTS